MTVRAHAMFTTFDPTSNAVITAATVNIYNPGTVTPISPTIFDRLGNPLSNPLTSDATTGLIDFYLTVAQEVDVVVSKTGFTTRTYSNVPVLDDSSLELTALLTTTGDTVYASSANTPVRLPIGTNNYVMNVTGGVPKWTSALQVSDANGTIGVGAGATSSTGVNIATSGLTGITQSGISCAFTASSAATSTAAGIASSITTAAASFTVTNGYTFQAVSPTLGASSAITNQYGYYAANQGASGITNAYGVYIAAQSGAATTNIGLSNQGTTQLIGGVALAANTSPPSSGVIIGGATSQNGGAGTLGWSAQTSSTATAGGGQAVPATILTYLVMNSNGTTLKIPCFAA